MLTTVLFYIFGLVLVVSGLLVVTIAEPVAAALFLILAFFNAAACWILLSAEFLALLLVLVYVGAIMVLFLFVVMMLDTREKPLKKVLKRVAPWVGLVGALMIVEIALMLWRSRILSTPLAYPTQATIPQASVSNTHAIGKLIYTEYIFAFEIAGLVLLAATIAAVALMLRQNKAHKLINPAQQIRTEPDKRLRLVK